jgi:hypothetical protein
LATPIGRTAQWVDEKGYQETITEAGEKIVAQEPREDQKVNKKSTRF